MTLADTPMCLDRVWSQVGPTTAAATTSIGSASAPSATNAHGDATAVGPAAAEKPSFSVLVLPEQESIRDEDHDIVDEMSVFQLLMAHRAAKESGVEKAALVGQVFTRPSATSVLTKEGLNQENVCSDRRDFDVTTSPNRPLNRPTLCEKSCVTPEALIQMPRLYLTRCAGTRTPRTQVYGQEVAKQVQRLYPQFRCLAWGQLNALFTNQLLEHPELQVVWDELLSAGTGEDIYLKLPMHYLNTDEVYSTHCLHPNPHPQAGPVIACLLFPTPSHSWGTAGIRQRRSGAFEWCDWDAVGVLLAYGNLALERVQARRGVSSLPTESLHATFCSRANAR